VIVRWSEWVWGVIWIWSRECLFHELDYSLRLLDKIAVLFGVCKLHNLAIGDCSSDSSPILVFFHKNCVSLTEFQHIDGSARWLTSFNSNHNPHAGTLPSTGHFWPMTQLLLCLSCAPEDETFCLLSKNHIDHAAIRNWPIKSNHWYFELITDYLKIVKDEYGGKQRTLRNDTTRNHVILRRFLPEESDKLGCCAGVIQVTLTLTHDNS